MDKIIIIFDGVCSLCDFFVQFIIAHDSKSKFKFVLMQSDTAIKLIKENKIISDNRTVILIDGADIYYESDAVIKVFSNLDGYWRVFRYLKYFPKFLRDKVYRCISRKRYQFFSRKNECSMPEKNIKDRFMK